MSLATGLRRLFKKDDVFELALKFVLKWEGGYSNHPRDPGGATNKGITHRVYDAYRQLRRLPPESVRNITDKEVREIYRQMYWNVICGEKLPRKLAIAVFDFAVNSGARRAIKYLQKSLGVRQDGVIGPVTLNAASMVGDIVLQDYLGIREHFYYSIGKGPREVFLKGWMNRLNDLRNYLKTIKE